MTDTEVSKTNPLVKQILEAFDHLKKYRGKIVIVGVPPNWEHTEYIDDKTDAFYLNLATLVATGQVRGYSPQRPRYGGDPVIHQVPTNNEVLIHHWRLGSKMVELIVRDDVLDYPAISVATDALLSGDKKGAATAVAGMGAFAGLGLAIAHTHAKALSKGERGDAPKRKKTAAQLDREIDAALALRKLG